MQRIWADEGHRLLEGYHRPPPSNSLSRHRHRLPRVLPPRLQNWKHRISPVPGQLHSGSQDGNPSTGPQRSWSQTGQHLEPLQECSQPLGESDCLYLASRSRSLGCSSSPPPVPGSPRHSLRRNEYLAASSSERFEMPLEHQLKASQELGKLQLKQPWICFPAVPLRGPRVVRRPRPPGPPAPQPWKLHPGAAGDTWPGSRHRAR
mmetsp:Transcript_15415/g.18547  ORF Transcript_15415/g.18547 Transcript_15415/m.18547 type:complete len:205 (+) Transcript_15415:75-689(+)